MNEKIPPTPLFQRGGAYFDYYQQLKPSFMGGHLPWLRATRETNLADFLTQGFPNRLQENWKYTDLTFLHKQSLTWNPHDITLTREQLDEYTLVSTDSHRLVFIDGYFSVALSTIHTLPAGVTLMSLNEALLLQPEQLKPYLAQGAQASNSLTILNTAFMNDGIFLHVAKNTAIQLPVHVLFLSTDVSHHSMTTIRNIIQLEDNSQVNIIEQHVALNDAPSFKNVFSDIVCQSGSQLNYYKLQQENTNTIHIAYTKINQQRDSHMSHHAISLGAKLARDDLHVALNAPGAHCTLNGFYAPATTQHIDHHTRVDHFSPHGSSDEYYKGILQDHATGVFNGKVVVHPHAQKTCSQQFNKNLLLAKTASINTKPELEIYADDVKCAHGATVGQIEPEALFYLRSRGLNTSDATALLIHAFYNEILERMPSGAIANHIRKAIEATLEIATELS